jgi:hypothetical protein
MEGGIADNTQTLGSSTDNFIDKIISKEQFHIELMKRKTALIDFIKEKKIYKREPSSSLSALKQAQDRISANPSLRYMVYNYPSEEGGKCALLPYSKSSKSEQYVDYYDLYEKKNSDKKHKKHRSEDNGFKEYNIHNTGNLPNYIISEIKSEVAYGINYIKNVASRANSLINNETFTIYPTNDFKLIKEYMKK